MNADDPKSDEIAWDVLGPKRNSTYSTRIVAAVRDALFDKQLKPGDFLGSEKDLAAKFGVSRMAARDAMRTLEAIGIVDIRVGAGGGARIASGNDELFADVLAIQLNLTGVSAREIIEAQQIIEPTAARLAAECGTDEEIANIAAIVERSAKVIHQNDNFTRAALDFHLSIAAVAVQQAPEFFGVTTGTKSQSARAHQQLAQLVILVTADIFGNLVKRGEPPPAIT